MTDATTDTPARSKKIRLGISTCLLGENVRYDGGHKLDRWLRDELGHYVDYVPVCPEAECGLGIPREAMRLVGDSEDPRLVTIKTGIDHTDRMKAWSRERVNQLAGEGLSGFIFKAKSPSSGMERVKVYDENGMPSKSGRGIFARIFIEHFPLLPVEEEGRLNDPRLRENFIERIFVMQRWQEMERAGVSRGSLVDFHAAHKLLIMAHNQAAMRRLGRLVAELKGRSIGVAAAEYVSELMATLARPATVKKNTNVLQHVMGYFKKHLETDEKQELLEIIERYHAGLYPLIVPITMLNHHLARHKPDYLKRQHYLDPHPVELRLRTWL